MATNETNNTEQIHDQEITEKQNSANAVDRQGDTNRDAVVEDQTANEQNAEQETVEKTDAELAAENLAGWQRATADLENMRKRHDEERALFVNVGKESLLRDLIPMMDNFEAAFSNREVWESVDQNWRVGIEYIYNQFNEVLSRHGIEKIGAVGETFNASIHESVESYGDSNEVTVVRQTGYKMGDKVVRPAKVVLGSE